MPTLLTGTAGPSGIFWSGLSAANTYFIRVSDTLGGGYEGAVTTSPVPLPAAAWLLLSGLAGVGAFVRRQRAEAAASI